MDVRDYAARSGPTGVAAAAAPRSRPTDGPGLSSTAVASERGDRRRRRPAPDRSSAGHARPEARCRPGGRRRRCRRGCCGVAACCSCGVGSAVTPDACCGASSKRRTVAVAGHGDGAGSVRRSGRRRRPATAAWTASLALRLAGGACGVRNPAAPDRGRACDGRRRGRPARRRERWRAGRARALAAGDGRVGEVADLDRAAGGDRGAQTTAATLQAVAVAGAARARRRRRRRRPRQRRRPRRRGRAASRAARAGPAAAGDERGERAPHAAQASPVLAAAVALAHVPPRAAGRLDAAVVGVHQVGADLAAVGVARLAAPRPGRRARARAAT